MLSDKIEIINLPKIIDDRGNLSFFEGGNNIPFQIKRCYWIYDVPGGETRGGHSYHKNEEVIIALSGSFDVILDDGFEQKKISLNRSYHGIFVQMGIWRHMENFSTNSLALIVASQPYDEYDYQRDYNLFLKTKGPSE